MLNNKSVNFTIINFIFPLSILDDGPSIQEVLLELTSQRTVPNVFINGNHIGGCDQTFQVIFNFFLLCMKITVTHIFKQFPNRLLSQILVITEINYCKE